MRNAIKVLPSLLAADFGNLERESRCAESSGGDELHIDIMDGHFVPNLSMGPDVVRMARRIVRMPLSVHLMVTNPQTLVAPFIEAGAGIVFIHIEADCDAGAVLRRIRELGARPGITLNPGTPPEAVFPVLEFADEVLCMTVRPGYGGQKFMPEVLPNIRTLRRHLASLGLEKDIMVDGGINPETAAECASHGANAFVAGVFLFGAADMAAEIRRLRDSVSRASQ